MSLNALTSNLEGLSSEKLRVFIRELDPQARATLLMGLERAKMLGEPVPGGEVLISELQNAMRGTALTADRMKDPRRLFFEAASPFLINEPVLNAIPGRIRRTSLVPLWIWFGRDVCPKEVADYERSVIAFLQSGQDGEAKKLVHMLYGKIRSQVTEMMETIGKVDSGKQRLIAQMGGSRSLEDLENLLVVMKNRELLASLSSKIATMSRSAGPAEIKDMRLILEAVQKRASDVTPFVFVLLMNRMMQPSSALRILVNAAETDSAAKISAHPLAPCINIVFGELERALRRCVMGFRRSDQQAAISAMREFHGVARGLSTEVDFTGSNPWTKSIGGLRSEISRTISREIELLPKRILDILNPQGSPYQPIPAADLAALEADLDVLDVARACASELALNELATRLANDVRVITDSGTSAMVERLKSPDVDYDAMLPRVEAAVRIANKVLGSGFAQLVQKTADMAGQERRHKNAG
jgi:hypothetical protein